MDQTLIQRCWGCGVEREAVTTGAVCRVCGAPLRCPPPDQWPRSVKKLIVDRLLALTFAPHGGPTHGWPKLLAAVFRGYWFKVPGDMRQQLVRHADPADSLYALALVLAGEFTPASNHSTTEGDDEARRRAG